MMRRIKLVAVYCISGTGREARLRKFLASRLPVISKLDKAEARRQLGIHSMATARRIT